MVLTYRAYTLFVFLYCLVKRAGDRMYGVAPQSRLVNWARIAQDEFFAHALFHRVSLFLFVHFKKRDFGESYVAAASADLSDMEFFAFGIIYPAIAYAIVHFLVRRLLAQSPHFWGALGQGITFLVFGILYPVAIYLISWLPTPAGLARLRDALLNIFPAWPPDVVIPELVEEFDADEDTEFSEADQGDEAEWESDEDLDEDDVEHAEFDSQTDDAGSAEVAVGENTTDSTDSEDSRKSGGPGSKAEIDPVETAEISDLSEEADLNALLASLDEQARQEGRQEGEGDTTTTSLRSSSDRFLSLIAEAIEAMPKGKLKSALVEELSDSVDGESSSAHKEYDKEEPAHSERPATSQEQIDSDKAEESENTTPSTQNTSGSVL